MNGVARATSFHTDRDIDKNVDDDTVCLTVWIGELPIRVGTRRAYDSRNW